MSFTVTAFLDVTWTDGVGKRFTDSASIASVAIPTEHHSTSDNSGYDTIYDASQTTVPPIGNADTGDAPFLFVIRTTGEAARLQITDSAASIAYMKVPADGWLAIPSDTFGSTTSTTIEQIDIQSVSGTNTEYWYAILRD